MNARKWQTDRLNELMDDSGIDDYDEAVEEFGDQIAKEWQDYIEDAADNAYGLMKEDRYE